METPIRKYLKQKEYQRHKVLRRMKKRQQRKAELMLKIAEKLLKRKLPKMDDGTEPNIFRYDDGRYVYQAAPGTEEIEVSPINTLIPDPALWTYQDASGKIYTPKTSKTTTDSVTQSEKSNPFVGAVRNYVNEAAWRIKNDPSSLLLQGKYTMPLIASPWLKPLGEYIAGTSMAGIPTTTWMDTALKAGFAGHGLNHWINEGTSGWGDAAMTALEVAPIGELVNPIYKQVVEPGMKLFNSPLTGNWTKIGNNEYRLNPNSIGTGGIPVESRRIGESGISKIISHPKGTYRRIRNFFFPKKHNYNYITKEDFTSKAWDAERKAAAIATRLNDDSPFLFRGDMTESILPGGFSQRTSPISITIDGLPIHGTVAELVYSPGGIVFTPKFGKPSSNKTRVVSFDSDHVPIEFSSQAGVVDKRFQIENNPEFNQAIAENISKLENKSGAPVVGSSRLISENLIGGVPGDVEIIVPKSRLQLVSKQLKFDAERRTANNTGWTGYSEEALRGSEANNLDINVLDDNGTIIHQMESTRSPNKMPKEYSALAKSQQGVTDSDAIKKSVELNIPKDDDSGFYTAEEYFDLIKKNPETLTLSVVDNAFKSNKNKHVGRAFVMMNSDNPSTIKKVSTAIDHMVNLVPGMKRFSQIYKSQSFNNIEQNKQILQKIGFAPIDADKFASNPELMKNIVDYWYMRKTVGTRSVNFEPMPSGDTYENVMSAVRQYGNGDSAGGGGNTILGGTYGGFTRNHTSYSAYKPRVDESQATFDDVFAAFEREKNIWKDEDVVDNAIKEVLNEENPFLKIDPEDVINNSSYKDASTFTSYLSKLVDLGKLTHEEANYLVERIADKLGVSGVRGSSYGLGSRHVGDYFGALRKPNNVAYRNIDSDVHNIPILPAEFGSDEMFFLNSNHPRSIITEPEVVSRVGKMTTEDAIKNYPENVIDMRPYHQLAKAMLNAKKGIRLNKASYDNDVLAEASGFNKAREHRKIMENTYAKRNKEYMSKMFLYMDNKDKLRTNLKTAALASGFGAAAAGLVAYANYRGQINDAVWEYYNNNQKEIDRKIERRLGLDFNNKDNWSSQDWRKFEHFILREYKRNTQNELRNK